MENGKSALKLLSEQYLGIFEERLRGICEKPGIDVPARLHESMAYSLLAGGKRLRPILCLAAAERSGVSPEKALPMAAAVEFVHTASLIHDDLPCMDDDDFRRGAPTNHKKFGEGLALLVGDALLIWAFGYALTHLRENALPPERVLRAVDMLAEASGPAGICGGQTLDIDAQSQEDGRDFVYKIAGSKTAALIRAAVVSGAALGDITNSVLRCYHDYGTHLGIAFQIVDDILDVTSTREELGKTPNKDEAQNKKTFVSVYGLEGARALARSESEKAERALEHIFPEGELLRGLAKSLTERTC